ncbi:MAG: O-methyltransferase [Acidobacteriia bacterium]|nr:O-methyltransferase [Terriglobia bacterium]
MPGILEPQVEEYVNALLPRRDAVLREMERYAAKHRVPIVGPACGRLLYQLARLARVRRVFEMGSAIGYSTLWLARAVGPQGIVYYTDSDPANTRRAEASLRRAGVAKRVKFLIGDALEMLAATPGKFDLIFNDVNKPQYPKVLRMALPRLRPGGLFITDNVLWSGRTACPAQRGEASTRAIQQFNRLLYKSPGLFTTILPLRDGFAVAVKES